MLDRIRPRSLPPSPKPLVDREEEIATISRELHSGVRLLTLTGPPGVGKTRLALAVAAQLDAGFDGGIYFVDLSPLDDPALVLPSIARVLGIGVPGTIALVEGLAAALRHDRNLLILDNFEQVADAADDIGVLLRSCPGLVILATSRAPLRVSWEHEYLLAPLRTPDPAQPLSVAEASTFPSMTLFVDRARAVSADFDLTEQNVNAVAAVCSHVDGLPLGVELAAARVKMLPPQAMLDWMRYRFDVLTSAPRDAPPRHRSLRNAVAWSYNLLDDSEQRLFRRLGIFVGGCTIEGALAVCREDRHPDVLAGLASLVDKSLLQREALSDGSVRFKMLETIKEYALERLAASGEADEIQHRHIQFFLALAERGEDQLSMGAGQGGWLDAIGREVDNIRGALRGADVRGDTEAALRMLGALFWFWFVRGLWLEARQWLNNALANTGDTPTPGLAKALVAAGILARSEGDFGRANELLERASATSQQLNDRRGHAFALAQLGLTRVSEGDHTRASALLHEANTLFDQARDQVNKGRTLWYLADLELSLGNHAKAMEYAEESVRILRATSYPGGTAVALNTMGEVAYHRGEFARAAALSEEALAIARKIGYEMASAQALRTLGLVAHAQRDLPRAAALLQESLVLYHRIDYRHRIAQVLQSLAQVDASRGQWGRVATLLGAAAGTRRTTGARLRLNETPLQERLASAARHALGVEAYTAAYTAGETKGVHEAMEYARLARETPATPRRVSPLTKREEEIAALVAQGLTNSQIAGRLVITERTAANHVQHILNKLGFGSRSQIAVWAVDQGLQLPPGS